MEYVIVWVTIVLEITSTMVGRDWSIICLHIARKMVNWSCYQCSFRKSSGLTWPVIITVLTDRYNYVMEN